MSYPEILFTLHKPFKKQPKRFMDKLDFNLPIWSVFVNYMFGDYEVKLYGYVKQGIDIEDENNNDAAEIVITRNLTINTKTDIKIDHRLVDDPVLDRVYEQSPITYGFLKSTLNTADDDIGFTNDNGAGHRPEDFDDDNPDHRFMFDIFVDAVMRMSSCQAWGMIAYLNEGGFNKFRIWGSDIRSRGHMTKSVIGSIVDKVNNRQVEMEIGDYTYGIVRLYNGERDIELRFPSFLI